MDCRAGSHRHRRVRRSSRTTSTTRCSRLSILLSTSACSTCRPDTASRELPATHAGADCCYRADPSAAATDAGLLSVARGMSYPIAQQQASMGQQGAPGEVDPAYTLMGQDRRATVDNFYSYYGDQGPQQWAQQHYTNVLGGGEPQSLWQASPRPCRTYSAEPTATMQPRSGHTRTYRTSGTLSRRSCSGSSTSTDRRRRRHLTPPRLRPATYASADDAAADFGKHQ